MLFPGAECSSHPAGQMGCRCCRMMKSIYDPSVPVEVVKSDSTGASLYQRHQLPGEGGNLRANDGKQKQGFHNLGYSNATAKYNDDTLKLEAGNNHINRLHAAQSNLERKPARQGRPPAAEEGPYIIQPDAPGPRWVTQDHREPSPVPVYPNIQEYASHSTFDQGSVEPAQWMASDDSIRDGCGCERSSADEADEGMGGTPDYSCDTGDEGSVLSGDVHTSTTSLSSADTKDEKRAADSSTLESGISVARSEEEREEDIQSVTDSMVAEALAALEAATAGEDCE
ncbi:uncharacterized protein FYW47_015927 [Aplochiton taeniatus]